MQSAGRPASSYYDPEGETIYLSPTPASKGPEKARRRPELNDVFGYVGSATLLVAYLFVANQILRKHPVVVDCMNLFGSACVRFGAETKFHSLHAIDATSQRLISTRAGGLQLLLQEGLRPHVPRGLLVRHRVRHAREALHISLLFLHTFRGEDRDHAGTGGTRLRPRLRLRR